ncbi:MAG: hypothetical protein ACJ8GO_09340 [Ramlibacter sp.]|jgi:hypothetical protein
MSQQALIRGEVTYRVGDGMMMPVPSGPVDIDISDDSVTIGWIEGADPGSAAIPRDDFERYVSEGKIRIPD